MSIRFAELALAEPILRALNEEGYEIPTPIQQEAIPSLLEGRDLVGIAQTGTGKTAAFSLPMLQYLSSERVPRRPHGARALVLTPTRELAIQVGESVGNYGRHLGIKYTVIFGGVNDFSQKQVMAHGVDVLVATPGRLLDLMNQGEITLSGIEIFVLDEADRMLDMGFIHDVRKVIAKLPAKRQTLLFSATMPTDIADLARTILRDPVRVEITPAATTVESITQSLHFAEKSDKPVLLRYILQDSSVTRALVFSRTKHGANRICDKLMRQGIMSAAIHGNKSQNRRQEALAGFKDGSIRVLVATDIAARGIDVDDVSHVINFDMPTEPETYVHRIGRTARAGASGVAISFCSRDEMDQLKDIERTIRRSIPRAQPVDLSMLRNLPDKPVDGRAQEAQHLRDNVAMDDLDISIDPEISSAGENDRNPEDGDPARSDGQRRRRGGRRHRKPAPGQPFNSRGTERQPQANNRPQQEGRRNPQQQGNRQPQQGQQRGDRNRQAPGRNDQGQPRGNQQRRGGGRSSDGMPGDDAWQGSAFLQNRGQKNNQNRRRGPGGNMEQLRRGFGEGGRATSGQGGRHHGDGQEGVSHESAFQRAWNVIGSAFRRR